MTTLTYILLAYVILDVLCDTIVLAILLSRGWTLRGLAFALRNAMRR